MARTGFGSRFLLGRRTSGLLGQVLLTLLVLSLGFAFCVAGAGFGVKGLLEVLDPGAAMYRLHHVSSTGQAVGVFRFPDRLRATSGDRPPICQVVHEHYVSGKNGGWRHDASWSRSVGAVGSRIQIRAGEPVVLDPLDMLVVAPDQEPWFRSVLADVPYGGRLRAHCVASGETVFVEGCFDGHDNFTGCGAAALTITTGDGTAQPRIDAHASTVAGHLAAGAAALVAVLGYLWYVLRARPLADALLRRAGPAPSFPWLAQAVAVGVFALGGAVLQGLMVLPAAAGSAASRGRPGYLFGLLVMTVAGVLALIVRHRRNLLERAMAPVREAETIPLRDARGGVVELAVRVRDDGPAVTGVLDARPHAWVEVRVEETYVQGKQQVTRVAAQKHWPERIPVRDASGDGWLDLTHAELDLRSTWGSFKHGSRGALAMAVARSPIGTLNPNPTHRHWTVEQSVLDPGEALYVLGQCRRIEDPKATGSYRADSTMAVVGGDAGERIIVHAGDERSLLRSIGLERTYLDLLTAGLAGVAASLGLIMLALWAL